MQDLSWSCTCLAKSHFILLNLTWSWQDFLLEGCMKNWNPRVYVAGCVISNPTFVLCIHCYCTFYVARHGWQSLLCYNIVHIYFCSDRWMSVPTLSGHYGPVQDISWEPTRGAYLLSVSSDQTTRAYAPYVEKGLEESRDARWCEIGRPQIHGYNMQCVCTLNPALFVSGADEKVRRT